jgi:hypothetical protein
MVCVTRLVTVVDIDDSNDAGPRAPRFSLTARHEAVVDDGRRVVLLDDRGWTEQMGSTGGATPPPVWALVTVEELERTARVVVGPDEPVPGSTQAAAAASHWETLTLTLRAQGVEVAADELGALPHDVELSERILERIAAAR